MKHHAITSRHLRVPNTAACTAEFEARARHVLDLGFDGLVLDPELCEPEWAWIADYFPPETVRAAFAFTPLPRPSPLGKEPPPSVASLDREETDAARKRLGLQAAFLGEHGVDTLIVPPAEVDTPSRREVEHALGTAELNELPKVIESLRRRRSNFDGLERHVDSYLRVLDSALDAADRHGIRVALMPASLACEIPDAAQLFRVISEFAGAPLTVFANTLELERALYCQLDGASTFLEDFRAQLTGVVLEDGHLLSRHRAPGQGSVNFARWCEVRARDSVPDWTVDLAEGSCPEDLGDSLTALQDLDSGPPSTTKDGDSPFLDSPLRDFV